MCDPHPAEPPIAVGIAAVGFFVIQRILDLRQHRLASAVERRIVRRTVLAGLLAEAGLVYLLLSVV